MSPYSRVIDLIHDEIVAGTFPGACLLVHQRGRKVAEHYEGTYCSSTLRDNPLGPDVRHMLYSFSKGVSATMVAIARQRKLIDYDVPLCTYIPRYRGGWKDETTIRHLLNHTAGIPGCDLKPVYTEEEWDAALQTCCEALVEWKPGSRSDYHAKSAAFLAAEAVRSRVPGRPAWETLCREWLLDPIGAETMTFRIPVQGAVAITPQPDALPRPLNPGAFAHAGHPGGGVFGHLEDMIKILQLHLNGGVWNGRVILDAGNVAEMQRVLHRTAILEAQANLRTPDYEPYGVGWRVKLSQENDGFGLGNGTAEGAFGHAGIGTVMSVAIPQKQLAIAFISTNAPASFITQTRIRNGITDLINEIAAGP